MNYPTSVQKGFTLVEILVGLIIGLIATAAAISITVSILRSNSNNMKATRLNQELRAVMDVMARDLTRAGYSGTATGKSSDNPFMNSPNSIFFTTSQITFTYDVDDNGVVSPTTNEYFGYRRNLNTTITPNAYEIQTRTTQAGGWQAFTDPRVINIATLRFTNQSQDLDGDLIPDINFIGITLTGALKSDPTVRRTLIELVRVRNDTDTTIP